MSFLPLPLPSGILRNGTEMQAAGRWYDANLVRWANGAMFPIGGWIPFVAAGSITGVARGAIAWIDNSGDRHLAIGTQAKLYEVDASGAVDDITPAGITGGAEDTGNREGYGSGLFGDGLYGTPRSSASSIEPAATWQLDTWGENLVGCLTSDGKLYEWPLTGDAAAITGAPTGCLGLLVTDERILFALGAGGNKRLVKWSDQEDNTNWTASTASAAGEKELQTVGSLMAGKRVRGQILLLTSVDAHVAEYVGTPFIYGFHAVGSSCGLIAANACAVINGDMAIWMGDAGSFYVYDGGSARAVKSDVADYLRRDIDYSQKAKIHAFVVSDFDEVWWFYPSVDGAGECDSYVGYSTTEGHWIIGRIDRTSGVDKGVWPNPLYIAPNGAVYEHEVGFEYDGATVFAESGPVQIGNGDRMMLVRKLIPDESTLGDVSVTFKGRHFPNADEESFGPYTLAAQTDVRFSARQVRLRIQGVRSTSWRWGTPRIEVQEAGKQ